MIVGFAGASCEIAALGDAAHTIARFVTSGFFCLTQPGSTQSCIHVHAIAPDQLSIAREGESALTIAHARGVETLGALLTEALIRPVTIGPTFHAAAIASDAGAIVLAASSGSGKSTLTAQMCLLRGWRYLTDEAVCFYPDGTVEGLPRPLHLRPNSRHILSASLTGLDANQLWQHGTEAWLAPDALNALAGGTRIPVRVLAFPRFDPNLLNGEANVSVLSPALALFRLTQTFFNPAELDRATWLANLSTTLSSVTCLDLHYGPDSFKTVAKALESARA